MSGQVENHWSQHRTLKKVGLEGKEVVSGTQAMRSVLLASRPGTSKKESLSPREHCLLLRGIFPPAIGLKILWFEGINSCGLY